MQTQKKTEIKKLNNTTTTKQSQELALGLVDRGSCEYNALDQPHSLAFSLSEKNQLMMMMMMMTIMLMMMMIIMMMAITMMTLMMV